jgi:CubicO group peptidase (beta-lactamase class C family)
MNRAWGWTLVLHLSACASPSPFDQPADGTLADSGAAYVPGAQWRIASAPRAGFDSARIATLTRDLTSGRYGSIDAVLIVRHGYLVYERYDGWVPSTAHTLQSVTKSVTALLFGIAAQNGGLELDRSVLDVFERYSDIASVDQRKRSLTLGHLLSMRTSMDFWESPYAESPLDQLNRSNGDWVRFVLDRPMTGEPGTTWSYNSGAPILICGALREVTGEGLAEFARRELFAPLGITNERWFTSPFDGLPHCGGGLFLKPADLARIGYLVLRDGRWGDRQVVPSAWLSAATRAHSLNVLFTSYGSDYGYYWWLFPEQPGGPNSNVIAASGAGGQWLFVIPKFDLVVAVAASNGNGLDLLYEAVLPAIRQR